MPPIFKTIFYYIIQIKVWLLFGGINYLNKIMIKFQNKAQQRQYFKNLKNKISSEEKNYLDKKIIENLLTIKEFQNAKIVMAYLANNIEVNIDEVLLNLIKNNKKIALPKCLDASKHTMNFYFINNFSDLIVGKYNIREPMESNNLFDLKNCINKNFIAKHIVMLVPGIAFDLKGYRLGYGKGYYDRYLYDLNIEIFKIGLCYSMTIADEIIKDDNDVPVDIIVTDDGVINITSTKCPHTAY